MDLQNSSSCSALSSAMSTDIIPKVGEWYDAIVTDFSNISVSIEPSDHLVMEFFSDICGKNGNCLVRYGWKALPFEYMRAGVYSKIEGMPAGPFLAKVM